MSKNTMICTASSMYIRNKPNTSGDKIGIIFKNQETEFIKYEYSEFEGETITWIKHKMGNITGYSLAAYLQYKIPRRPMLRAQAPGTTGGNNGGTGGNNGSTNGNNGGTTGNNGDVTSPTTTTTTEGENNTTTEEDIETLTSADVVLQEATNISVKGFKAILGLPYHFLEATDPRYSNGDMYGAEFTEKILSRCPILFIAPGNADFMSSYNISEKSDVLGSFITKSGADLSDLLSGSTTGRYYTFKYDLKSYYQYVNPMCRMAALNLHIEDRTYDGKKLAFLNWGYDTDGKGGIGGILNNLKNLIGNTGEFTSVPFYLNGETSISENFSNSSTESQMASAVNGISDLARELNFLLGYSQSAIQADFLDMDSAIQSVTDTVSGLMGKSSFISKLSNHLSTVATGGRMIFPKIWSSSNFSRSYSVEIKLVSPDADPYSIYLNILVPLFHLVCLVAPHQVNKDPNSYTNPFLVRCMYKGFFNIDLGLITNMSITKGAEGQWTPDGIPTTVTVSLSIEDLYDVMSITSSGAESLFSFDTVGNTALMDYIGTWCGIEMFKPEIGRLLNMAAINKVSTLRDTVIHGTWSRVQDSLATKIMNLYRGV